VLLLLAATGLGIREGQAGRRALRIEKIEKTLSVGKEEVSVAPARATSKACSQELSSERS
jgi:hypothetical protein